MILKKCIKCGKEFTVTRKDAKFCSPVCRQHDVRGVTDNGPAVTDNNVRLIETNEEETKRLYNESIKYFETHTLEQARAAGRWIPNRYLNGK